MIDILLATYNGERFLREQIESLLRQSETDWRLIARDDGSVDATRMVLQSYAARFPQKIHVLEDSLGRLGATQNFAALLASSSAPYIMFCDQDDVWDAGKISQTRATLALLEEAYGDQAPCLVHADARMADEALRPLHPSFAQWQKLYPRHCGLNRLLAQNCVQGATVLINRALATRAMPVPKAARMHDHWLALVAAAYGAHIVYLEQPVMDYRQHRANAVGARARKWIGTTLQMRQMMQANILQARALLDMSGDTLPPRSRQMLERFTTLLNSTWLARRRALLRHGFLRRPLYQNLHTLLWM